MKKELLRLGLFVGLICLTMLIGYLTKMSFSEVCGLAAFGLVGRLWAEGIVK